MKILVFSSLYPNSTQPNLGVFVENRTRRLAAAGCDVRVVAPVFAPVWPLSLLSRFRKELPDRVAVQQGLSVYHPVIPQVPGLWARNPGAMVGACLPLLREIARDFPFDVIDAHYFFPDGVAAAALSEMLGVPCVITARGSDVTDWPKRPAARRMILQAAETAKGLAGVSASLLTEMTSLGMDPAKMRLLRNGVDLEHFQPMDREMARARCGVSGTCVLSVAALVPLKSHHVTIEAIATIPDVHLLIAGQGPERAALQAQIDRLGVGDRVRLLGPVAHADLPTLYNAADIFVLSSTREGLPNVVLEAIACGTPVIATPVGGTVEVIDDARAGVRSPVGDVAALSAGISRMMQVPLSRADVRASAERFSWAATTAAQIEQLKQASVSR
jgi:teichuronic acid biosynthesis glycosyltransferase TuaC